ncbi:MAG TPA: RNA 2',3'-cyclic phosphodiesterase [Pyrinomonadaceae bacterium]|jgi:2'-5' RNA ligase|nr:RNA 2',3'-cyclic phosphodiesterase [Pyrinomonadaceae bacterium]
MNKNGSLTDPSSVRPLRSLRVFCALELPSQVRERAASHIADLRGSLPQLRVGWESPEKLHITVKFLGEIEPGRAAEVSSAAERAALGVRPFDLSIEGAGVFPPRGLARVLWLGVADTSSTLARLHSQLEDEYARLGFPIEDRPFNPHLTIARLRRPDGARELAALHREKGFAPAGFRVNSLVVLRSELGPGGSRYSELSRHPLTGRI